MRDLERDLELVQKATPPPWQFVINEQAHYMRLESEVSGHPYVMDCMRWGMNGAQFRFNTNGLMKKLPQFNLPIDLTDYPDIWLLQEAREGWPHAIRRAIAAEELARELTSVLEKVSDRLWITGTCQCFSLDEPCENCLAVNHANEVMRRAKEVLG